MHQYVQYHHLPQKVIHHLMKAQLLPQALSYTDNVDDNRKNDKPHAGNVV